MLEQYESGTELLWMAHYRENPLGGDMNGPSVKISGTTIQAATEAQKLAEKNGWILQCLRRRY